MSDLSAYAAKSKRASEDDVPRQIPMRPQSGIRNAPSTDQKRVRRAMSRGVRKSASKIFVFRMPGEGANHLPWYVDSNTPIPAGALRVTPMDSDNLSDLFEAAPYDDETYAETVGYRNASKETTVSDTVRREAALLSAMAKARPEEQARLVTELDDLRARRREAAAADSEMDFGARVVAAHLTPVPTHVRHSAATDWIDTLDVPSNDASLAMKTQATLWFSRTSAEVREDREEFAIQAEGAARRVASAHGEQMVAAERAFLDHVSHLYRTANDVPAVSGQNGLAESTITDYKGLAPVTEDKAFTEGWAGEPDDTGVHPSIPGAGGQTPPGPTSTSVESSRRTAAPYNGGQQVPVSDIKVGDVISGWADGTLTIATSNGRSADSFRGKVTNIETERIDRSEANGGAYDSVSKITVQNLSGDTTWTVEPFLDVSKVTREAAGTTATRKTADVVDDVIRYEQGEMDEDEVADFFQGLIDSGMVWSLQGSYGRTARDLIDAGICHPAGSTASKTATPGTDQNGNATSGLPDVTVHTNTDSKFPWELDENEPGTGAADVASVATPGGPSGYPQPTASRRTAVKIRFNGDESWYANRSRYGTPKWDGEDGHVYGDITPTAGFGFDWAVRLDPSGDPFQAYSAKGRAATFAEAKAAAEAVLTASGLTLSNSSFTASRTAAAPTQQELDDQAEAEAEQRAEQGADRYREDRLTDYYDGDPGDDTDSYYASRKTAGGVDLYALKVGDQVLYSRPGSDPLVMTVRREIESVGAPENRTVSLNLTPGGFSTEVSPSGVAAGYYDVSPVGTTASVNPVVAQFRARVQASLAREAGRKTAAFFVNHDSPVYGGETVSGPFESREEAEAALAAIPGPQYGLWSVSEIDYRDVDHSDFGPSDGDWTSWLSQNNID